MLAELEVLVLHELPHLFTRAELPVKPLFTPHHQTPTHRQHK